MKLPRNRSVILTFIFAVVMVVIFLYPFFLILINSFKTFGDLLTNPLGLPKEFSLKSYAIAWESMRYPKAFINTLVITVVAVAGKVLLGSMAGYKLQRTKKRYSRVIYLLCVSPMLIPFHSIMFPFMKIVTTLGFYGSITGVIIIYLGFTSFDIFLFYNFVSTVPTAIEESAVIDGAGPFRTYFQIVFPLLRPVTATVIVLASMSIWNDMLIPLLLINSKAATRTLTLSAIMFYGLYATKWHVALAGLILTILPIIFVFIVLQRFVVKGITAGAIK